MPAMMRFTLPDPDTLSPLRAMHSLREKHVLTLAQALSRLPGTWSLERHESYDGDLTLMLRPQQQEGENLVVSRRADGFHLIANQEDCRKLGCFGAMDELVATMRSSAATAIKSCGPAGKHT